MLDVYRSDSQKSDSSPRPRVSFNRDVRIKKIGNSDAASIVEALAGDGEGHLVPTPVRREKIKASKRELALEADRVLKQADGVSSLHSASPTKRQPRSKPTATDGGSLQRKTSFGGIDSKKWNSEGKLSSYMSLDRPKNRIRKREPPAWDDLQRHRSSSTDLTAAAAPPKRRSTLTRSASDAGDRDDRRAAKDAKRSISLFGTIERIKTKIKKRPAAMRATAAQDGPRKAVERSAEPATFAVDSTPSQQQQQQQPPPPPPPPPPVRAKKQLSPIIESSPRDEYFKYSVGGPFAADEGDDGVSPARPVRGHKVDRIVRQLQKKQQQQQQQQRQRQLQAATHEPVRPPSLPDLAHAHNGNEPFSYTAPSSPTIVHLQDATTGRSPPPPQQYRSPAGMDDTWTTSYDDLSHRRDALESRLQKRAAVYNRPQLQWTAGGGGGAYSGRARTAATGPPADDDTYATVYKKNETLGGGDRYFERKIVTEHRFARRTPRLSGDGLRGGDEDVDDEDELDDLLLRRGRDEYVADGRRGKPQPSRAPTIVSRNNVAVVNGRPNATTAAADRKPGKKRSRLDKFKMLFTGGGSASKENKRPVHYNSSDPESYTSSLRRRYNVFTGADNNKHVNTGNRRTSSPGKTSKSTGNNNAWFKSLDRFGKKNKRSKTFTSGSENDDEVRVHKVNDRIGNPRGTTRSYHSVGNLNSMDMEDYSPRLTTEKRHSLIDSSAGSTTEGDSSQKSHKSTVYLHATTVGEIPESRQLHQSVFGAKSRRAASREELSSRNDALGGGAQKRTLSRSVSVLAPWAPRQTEGRTVDYDERGRPPKAPSQPSSRGGKAAAKASKSDPEESSSRSAARRNLPANRASSGEESSLLDEVIIRTTGRTGKMIKDDRSTSRQIGRSMSSAAANRGATAAGGTLTRGVRTKS